MLSTISLLLVIALVVSLWLDGARAREMATVLAHRYCDHRGLQFLDETVALVRVGLRWTTGGLRIRRMFRFDFSREGAGRRIGYVLMLGSSLELIDDGLSPPGDDDNDVGGSDGGSHAVDSRNVVPFRPRKRDD